MTRSVLSFVYSRRSIVFQASTTRRKTTVILCICHHPQATLNCTINQEVSMLVWDIYSFQIENLWSRYFFLEKLIQFYVFSCDSDGQNLNWMQFTFYWQIYRLYASSQINQINCSNCIVRIENDLSNEWCITNAWHRCKYKRSGDYSTTKSRCKWKEKKIETNTIIISFRKRKVLLQFNQNRGYIVTSIGQPFRTDVELKAERKKL